MVQTHTQKKAWSARGRCEREARGRLDLMDELRSVEAKFESSVRFNNEMGVSLANTIWSLTKETRASDATLKEENVCPLLNILVSTVSNYVSKLLGVKAGFFFFGTWL